MQSVKAVIRQKWFLASQNKPAWIHLGLTVFTALFLIVPPGLNDGKPTDLPIRFCGMILQLIGAFTVWLDMTSTASDFGMQPVDFGKWLKGFFSGPEPIVGAAAITLQGDIMASAGVTGTLTVTEPTLQERVETLEKEASRLRDALANVRQEIQTQKTLSTANLKNLEAQLSQELQVLEGRMKDALVGNYKTLRVGAIWLVFGIFLSSVSIELTNIFHLYQLPKFW